MQKAFGYARNITASIPFENPEDAGEFAYEESEHEYFAALINTLSKEEQEIYRGYKDPFREGYVKLNQGHFEEAALLARPGNQ
jgi:hypothetical protein